MPPKNSMDTLSRWNEDEFIDQIISIKKNFESVFLHRSSKLFNKIWIERL